MVVLSLSQYQISCICKLKEEGIDIVAVKINQIDLSKRVYRSNILIGENSGAKQICTPSEAIGWRIWSPTEKNRTKKASKSNLFFPIYTQL